MIVRELGRLEEFWKWAGMRLTEWRSWGFSVAVGIFLTLFYYGTCEGRIEEGLTPPAGAAADACNGTSNGTIGHCFMENEVLVDDADEIKDMYEEFVELVMGAEISRRIFAAKLPYLPIKKGAAKQGAKPGRPYTRPCIFKNRCDRKGSQ